MRIRSTLALVAVLSLAASAGAVDYSVEPLEEGPPKELSGEISKQLQTKGIKVKRGEKSTYCDIWLAKQWPVKEGFKPTLQELYPFEPGQLVGAIRYYRDRADFRDQTIPQGVYTLRFALQPVDGNHVGTAPTRDFFLLLKAEDDKSPEPLDYKKFTELSTNAVEADHPGMLYLQLSGKKPEELPSIRHNESKDWWIVTFQGNALAGEKKEKLTVELVVVGTTTEF